MPDVVVLGSLNMDLGARTARMPRPGETVFGEDFVTVPGGKGANQAVAAARAGASVTMVACVGDDAQGEAYIRALHEEGIDTDGMRVVPDAKTGVALISVQRGTGQNCIAVCPGANLLLTPGDVDRARERIASSSGVLAQLEVRLETVLRAATLAREAGVPFLLNPSPVPREGVPSALLGLTDYLILNDTEIRRIGLSLGTEDPRQAARRLVADGLTAVALTRGAEGCVIVDAAGERCIEPFAVKPVDAVGAGDAFAGALAAALAEGRPLSEAALLANAAGALAVTVEGAMPSLPPRVRIDALLRESDLPACWA